MVGTAAAFAPAPVSHARASSSVSSTLSDLVYLGCLLVRTVRGGNAELKCESSEQRSFK